jgi:hypothetical protein
MSHIIAVDGAYVAYPGAIRHPRSAPEQHAVIREVCEATRVGCTLHAPATPFEGNETEKRSFGFRLAEQIATDGDWYFLMDADQVITNVGNLHNVLGATSLDVADVLFYERGTPAVFPVRCVFRAVPGLRVAGRHYDYIAADGRNLWGDPPLCPAALTGCEVEHRTRLRHEARRQAQQAYYQRREELGIETPALAG